jgi:tetratricopeptide (TPR) repeat protein
MIPIPYEQVDEFLQWLSEHHPSTEPPTEEVGNVKEVLAEYLRTRGRVGALTPLYALRIFQTCPMMYEPNVRDQMIHFVGCGGCLHYIHERHEQYPRWLELHPLLQGFLRFCEQTRWGATLESASKGMDSTWLGEGQEYINHFFREYIHRIGPDLLRAFEEYLGTTDPSLVSDYETNRSEWMESPRRPLKPSKDWTEPLVISEGFNEAAERLIGSVYLLLEGHFYKQAREDPGVYRVMESLGLLTRNASRGIEFFTWLKENFPDLDLFGNVPTEGIVELALSFCEEKGYTDAKTFSQEAIKWIRGDAEQLVLRRLAGRVGQPKHDIGKQGLPAPLGGNGATLYHAMFLYQSSGDFPTFIKRYWKDLNYLTARKINLYYSLEDLERKGVDPATISRMRGIQLESALLPSLLLWKGSLSRCFVLPLIRLSHEDIFELMKLLMRNVVENAELEKIIPEAQAFIERKLATPLRIPRGIVDNGGLRIEEEEVLSAAENGSAAGGRVYTDHSNYVVANLKDVGLTELADVLRSAHEAVKTSKDLSAEQKSECIEVFNQIGEEAAKPKPNNTMLTSLTSGLKSGFKEVRGVSEAVDSITEALRKKDKPVGEKAKEIEALLARLEQKEKTQRRNALIYVGLPLLVGLALTVWAFWQGRNLRLLTQETQTTLQGLTTQKQELEAAKAQLSRMNAANEQIRLGVSSFYSKDYTAAIAAYDKAIELDPTNAVVFDLKGYSLLKAGDTQKAIDVLKQATTIQPSYVWAHYDLALAYWAGGDTSSAIAEVRKVITADPALREVIKNDAQFNKFRSSPAFMSIIGE